MKTLCGVILVGAVLINQTAIHWRTDVADSHLFAYFGWCITQGARPYLDVWDNKPPGIWWANAAAIRLCGPGVEADMLLGAAALAVSLASFAGIARTAYHRSLLLPAALIGAVLLTDVRFESGGNRTETLVVTCETVAVFGYLRWLRTKRPLWLALGGLAAGIAPLFKQAGAAAAAACALHLAWVQWCAPSTDRRRLRHLRGWRLWLIGGGALVAPLLAAAAVLAYQGALGEAAFAIGEFNRAYFTVNDATWFRLDRAIVHYRPALRLLAGVLVIAGLGLAGGLVERLRKPRIATRRRPPRRGSGLFLLWFAFAAYLTLVGPGRRSYHLMPVLPALALLTLYPLHLLAARRGLRACLTARPGAAVAVVVYLYVLGGLVVGNGETLGRYWRTKPAWCALRGAQLSPFDLQAAEIDRLTRPDDTIYVWGWSPGTYRYACRRPASRYATFEKLGQVGPYARFIFDHAQADIRRNPPRVVVIGPPDYQALVAAPAGEFGQWLATRYEVVSTIGGMHILLRR